MHLSKPASINLRWSDPLKTPASRLLPLGIVLVCGFGLILASFLVSYLTWQLGHDQSSYLFEAQRFLGGAEIYGPLLSETNPPLIIWFSAIPVAIAHWFHGSPQLCFRLLVTAIIFGSTIWSLRILRRSSGVTNPIALALIGCAILFIEFSIGTYDFGQREHLLLLLLLPYVLAVATRVVYSLPFAERCALGIAAGIAIWFKPFDVLILIALELVLLVQTRSIRRVLTPEFISSVLSSSLIFLLVLVFTPLYVKQMLPLLFDTYWGLGDSSALQLVLSSRTYPMFICFTFVAWLVLRRYLRDATTAITLFLCSIAASFAFDLQHITWAYHRYPHKALMLLAIAYLLVDSLHAFTEKLTSERHLLKGTMLSTAGIMVITLCWIFVHRQTVLHDPSPSSTPELDQFLSQYQPSTTIYVFSTGVTSLSSAYNHGLNWGSRFAHMWMLPAIIQNELGPTGPPVPYKQLSKERLAVLAALQRSQSAEDLNYWHPAVVLVQQCTVQDPCQGIEKKNFDIAAWLLRSPQFAAEWSHYQHHPGAPNHFELYTRDQ